MLVSVRTDDGRLGDDVHLALPSRCSVPQAGGRCLQKQHSGAVMKLRCGLRAHGEGVGRIGLFGTGGRLPCPIPGAVLHQGCGESAHAVGIVNLDGNGRGLPDDVYGRKHIQRGLATAGQDQTEWQAENGSMDSGAHTLILVCASGTQHLFGRRLALPDTEPGFSAEVDGWSSAGPMVNSPECPGTLLLQG